MARSWWSTVYRSRGSTVSGATPPSGTVIIGDLAAAAEAAAIFTTISVTTIRAIVCQIFADVVAPVSLNLALPSQKLRQGRGTGKWWAVLSPGWLVAAAFLLFSLPALLGKEPALVFEA